MLEKLKKTYSLFSKVESSNAMESLSFILEEKDLDLKSKLLNKLLNEPYSILKVLNILNSSNQLDILNNENIKIEEIDCSLVIYSYLYNQNKLLDEFNDSMDSHIQFELVENKLFQKFELKKLENKIKESLDSGSSVSEYAFDFLFLYCLLNNDDIDNYKSNLEDKSRVFDYELRFFKSTKDTLQGEDFIVINLFNIYNDSKNKMHFIKYITRRGIRSSSMNEIDWNEDFILNLFDFNTMDLINLFNTVGYNRTLLLSPEFQISTDVDKDKIDWGKVFKKSKINNSFEIDETYEMKIDLNLIKTKSNKIDLNQNKNLNLENKLFIIDEILSKHQFITFENRIKYLIFIVIDEISNINELNKYTNIKNTIFKLFIHYYEEYKNAKENFYMRMDDKNFDIIIQIEKILNDDFSNSLKEYIKTDISIEEKLNTIKILTYLIKDKKDLFEIFDNGFDIDNLIRVSKLLNVGYFNEYYKEYRKFFYDNKMIDLLLEYLIYKKDNKTIQDYFKLHYYIFKKNENIKNYIVENYEYFKGNKDIYFVNIFFSNNLIQYIDFEKGILNVLNKTNDFMEKVDYIENIKDPLMFIKKLNISNQFKTLFYFYLKEDTNIDVLKNNYIFDFIKENEYEILIDYDNIEMLVENNSIKNQLPFLELMVKRLESTTIASNILLLAEHLEIDIDEEYKEKFYYIFNTDEENLFEI